MSQPTCTKIGNCLTYTPGGNRNLTTVVVPSTRGPNHSRFSTGKLFVPKWTYVFCNQARHLDLSFLTEVSIGFTLCYPSCNPNFVNVKTKLHSVVTFMTYFRPTLGRFLYV